MLSREEIAEAFADVYECVSDNDPQFMQLTGRSCIDFAIYISEMSRNDALEEAAVICGKLKYLDATACAEALRALQD